MTAHRAAWVCHWQSTGQAASAVVHLQQCYPKHDRKEARRNDSAPTIPGTNRMPNGKPKIRAVTPCLLPRLDGTDLRPGQWHRLLALTRTPRSEPTMAHVLLIDDDPALIP